MLDRCVAVLSFICVHWLIAIPRLCYLLIDLLRHLANPNSLLYDLSGDTSSTLPRLEIPPKDLPGGTTR